MTNSHFNNLTSRTKNRWRSLDTHFATGLSALCNHSLWHRTSISVFWQSFYPLHVCFHWSLHCSLIVHINIFFKIYFKLSANCRSWSYSELLFLSINSRCHSQIRLTGCCRFQNQCQWYFHTTNSVLSKSGIQSLSCLLTLAYASSLKNWVLGCRECTSAKCIFVTGSLQECLRGCGV